MVLEWSLLLVALVSAGLVVRAGGRGMPRAAWAVVAVVLCGTLLGLGLRRQQLEAAGVDRAYLAEVLPWDREDDGYVGSDTCRACHPGEHATWHKTYHRTMTQRATPDAVRGDFDDVTLRFRGRTYHLTREGDRFFVDMIDPVWERKRFGSRQAPPQVLARAPRVRKRVVMTTGSHHYQVYWVPGEEPNQLHLVPLAYLFGDQRWIPRDDAFLQHPDFEQTTKLWNNTCIECHSTAGQKRTTSRGNNVVAASRTAELGISCEACHGPGAAHVARHRNPWTRHAALMDDEPDDTIVNPARLPHDRSTEVCGQCHIIGFIASPARVNQAGFAYRPGDNLLATKPPVLPSDPRSSQQVAVLRQQNPHFLRSLYWGDGEVRVAGRDFNAVAISGCYQRGKMSCLSCHSMHGYQDPSDQLKPDVIGDESCLQCHGEYRDDPTAHTHHAPGSTGSSCLNCHMAHTTYGLLGAIRSHAIKSPSVKDNLISGRPNACNLCHLDQTLAWTAQHLTQWYGQPPVAVSSELQTTAAGPYWTLKGEAGVRAIVAWHFAWAPAQAVSGTDWMAPFLSQLLVDGYAAIRHIAHKSLQTVPGYEDVVFDYVGAPNHWIEVRRSVEGTWARAASAREPDDRLLLDRQGLLQQSRYLHLQKTRDRRKVGLNE